MGGRLASPHRDRRAGSPGSSDTAADAAATAPLSLSADERKLIDSTWRQLTTAGGDDRESIAAEEEELGVRIFLRIFDRSPAVRDAFPQFGALADDRDAMRRNVVFRCHARRFVRAVRSVVDNLDALDVTAVPNLSVLGRRHRAFHGFQTDYLRTFEAAMEDVWGEELGRRFNKPTRCAWRKVFQLITSTVQHGYDENDGRACPLAAAAAAATRANAAPNASYNSNGSVTTHHTEHSNELG